MAKNRYPLDQSPFYKLVGLGKLSSIIRVDLTKLDQLLSWENYKVWENQRGREIQQPVRWLGEVHKRISNLLAKIEVPSYVFSQKGRSYVDNAAYHIGNVPLGKTDISKFYPSTTHAMVRSMFSKDFRCAADVATILANICCYQQRHLPTGSPLSGRIAFFAARSMFDKIEILAERNSGVMSLYVDDITISGPAVTRRLLSEVQHIVRQHGHKTKSSKTKTYSASSAKMVTGAVIVNSEVRLPNTRHKKIWESRRNILSATKEEKPALLRSLRGRLQEAKQISSHLS